MIELATIERYIYTLLKSIGADYGVDVRRLPFQPQNDGKPDAPSAYPVIYYGHVMATDRNAIGPGRRLLTSALYEIGVYHSGDTFGAVFPGRATALISGDFSLITLLTRIDSAFQDFSVPTTNPTGVVYSCQRESPVSIPEKGVEGLYYRRDGGLWRIHAEKA